MKHKLFILFGILGLMASCSHKKVIIFTQTNFSPRETFGAEKVSEALKNNNYVLMKPDRYSKGQSLQEIYIGKSNDSAFIKKMKALNVEIVQLGQKESFQIQKTGNITCITGFDDSGVLYGSLQLRDLINEQGHIPESLSISDHPEMILRGTAIGLQKTEYLPGHDVYEYPITQENFPWFYDKDLWIRYLDMLVENRYNSLYLWNGHPFASLVKLEDYPYAVEVDDSTFSKNKEMFDFITHEADKRGIWVIQMFYNIIVSKPFAEYNHIKTQDRSRPITPLLSDYTRKSIAAFIRNYPNVGLMVCLGEAMNTIDDDVKWFTETIIPGVKDGLADLGKIELPPIVLRGHDTDAKKVMEKAVPIYYNLYTTYKYNGESLTTYNPRGEWVERNKALSELGSVHISNVHIMANLEPFRYGSPAFIQHSVEAMHNDYGANGLHLYPQSSYWDWPYTADNASPRLHQIDRDWPWYKAWARYAWNVHRDSISEKEYWSGIFGDYYGCPDFGNEVLTAYEQSGEIAPKLLRRFGISDGNRQTLMLGMFMSQLVNPYKWHVYQSFYGSNGPEGEILLDYAEKEWKGLPHHGETPPQIIEQVTEHARLARQAILAAEGHVTKNKEEFQRLKNDMLCLDAFASFFAEKVKAAQKILRYKYSGDVADLEKALPHLEKSVDYYTSLVKLTENTYLYANSMQTQQRRIPIGGTDGLNKTWKELLPQYIQEKENLKNNITNLKNNTSNTKNPEYEMLRPVNIDILSDHLPLKPLKTGQYLYADKDYIIEEVPNELKNLRFLPLSFEGQKEKGTSIHFKSETPVKIVVGYFNGQSYSILPPPTLETNAHANDHGEADIKIANALNIKGLYPVNIYTYYFDAGENTLNLGKGIALVLGFMDGTQTINIHDAGMGENSGISIDWLFY